MLISGKNTLTKTSRIMFDYTSGQCDLANLSHKMNHHSGLSLFPGPEKKRPIAPCWQDISLSTFMHFSIVPSGSGGAIVEEILGWTYWIHQALSQISFLTSLHFFLLSYKHISTMCTCQYSLMNSHKVIQNIMSTPEAPLVFPFSHHPLPRVTNTPLRPQIRFACWVFCDRCTF